MKKIQIGSMIVSRDGQEVGEIDRVVLDPHTGAVTHLVARAGNLLTRDVVAPIADIEDIDNGRILLRSSVLELEARPDYFEADYVSPSKTELRSSSYSHGEVLYPVSRLRSQAPSDLVVGKPVECLDGLCGVIEEVQVDPLSGQVLSFRLHPEGRLTRPVVVPIEWVLQSHDRAVRIDCTISQLEELLPPVQTAHERTAE